MSAELTGGVFGWLRYGLYDWGGVNEDLFLAMHGSLPHACVWTAEWLSHLGSYWGAPVLLFALHAADGAAQLALFRFAAALLLALAAAAVAKAAFRFARPTLALQPLFIV